MLIIEALFKLLDDINETNKWIVSYAMYECTLNLQNIIM